MVPRMMTENESILTKWRNIYGTKPLLVCVGFALALLGAIAFLVITGGPWNQQVVAQAAAQKPFVLKHWIPYAIGWGCLAVAAAAVLILATARWWMRPTPPTLSPLPSVAMSANKKWVYAGLFLAVAVFSGWLRAPRLDDSFWNDEEMAFRSYVWGKYTVEKDDSLKFKQVPWEQTLYESKKGNNQVLCSVEARLGMALFNDPSKSAPAGLPAFQESAARFFPYLSGCFICLALGWLGLVLGSPRAGLAAALLMALNPWHMRYAVEMRGYSTHLLFLVLATGCLVKALQASGWRWWLLYGLTQALALLAYCGAAYWAVLLNAVAAGVIWFRSPHRSVGLMRLGIANAITLIPVAAILMPSLLQIIVYMKDPEMKTTYPPATLSWLVDFWHHLTIGFPQHSRSLEEALGTSLEVLRSRNRWAEVTVHYLIPGLVLLGVFQMLRRDWRGYVLVLPALLAATLSYTLSVKNGSPLLAQYLIYLLPTFCLAMAYAPSLLPQRLGNLLFIVVGIYAFTTVDARRAMTSGERQPMRKAAMKARHEHHVPTGEFAKTITVIAGQSAGQIHSYDPRAIELEARKDGGKSHLDELMARAQREQRPLIVYFCNRVRLKQEFPATAVALANRDNWVHESLEPGLEAMWSYQIYHYIHVP
jgi:hypothetical protein